MRPCSHMSSCPLFEVFTMNAALGVWKTNYCTSEYGRCVRYQLAQEGKEVPQHLLPNGKTLRVATAPGSAP